MGVFATEHQPQPYAPPLDWSGDPTEDPSPKVGPTLLGGLPVHALANDNFILGATFGQGEFQPEVGYPKPSLPVTSDKDLSAALAECRRECSEKFSSGLFLGWSGIPASDQPSMMAVCIRSYMQDKGFTI